MVLDLVPGHHLGFYAIATRVAKRGQHGSTYVVILKTSFLEKVLLTHNLWGGSF